MLNRHLAVIIKYFFHITCSKVCFQCRFHKLQSFFRSIRFTSNWIIIWCHSGWRRERQILVFSSQLEIIEVVPVYCNLVNNTCHVDSTVFHKFVPNKAWTVVSIKLRTSPSTFIFLKTFNSEFSRHENKKGYSIRRRTKICYVLHKIAE